MNSLKYFLKIIILISVLFTFAGTAIAQNPRVQASAGHVQHMLADVLTIPETDTLADETQQTRASGTFAPKGAPVEQPVRTGAGNKCIVDLKQTYSITGTLSGSLEIDYRILLDGPCGEPIGTFDEEWIAYGTFNGTVNGNTATPAKFSYTAKVRARGDVDGHIVFSEGFEGELNILGNFGDGHLSYGGWINQIKSDE